MLRIGILGASGIAPQAVIRPVSRRSGDVGIVAVASRREGAADGYAATWGIDHGHSSYPALLADPEVDLVYNSLPPSEHAEWTIAALEAGKDVLSEKPFTMNAAEARAVQEAVARTGHRAIEAFHDRYHPLSAEVSRLCAPERMGRILEVEATFSANNPFAPASIRHDPAVGGGALMDLGCYPVHWVRTLFGTEPTVRGAIATLNPLGADMSIDAALEFPGGVTARVVASMASTELISTLRVVTERGSLEAGSMVFPHRGHHIVQVVDGVSFTTTVAGRETYDHQLDAVVDALATGRPLPTEGDDPVANMAVIDAIYAAAGVR